MKAKKTRAHEMLVTIATSAICDFLSDKKKTTFIALKDSVKGRMSDYIRVCVDVWSEMNKKVDLYDFVYEWVAKDYASIAGNASVIHVLVGVPNSECKSVTLEY